MAGGTVTTTAELRWLLRTARGGLSQARAAKRVGISPGWWKRIENASQPTVTLNLLLRMFDAVAIMPAHLRQIGLEELADLLDEQHRVLGAAAPFDDPLECYLWGAPADPALRDALIAYARELRKVRTPARTEPFTDGLLSTRKVRPAAPRTDKRNDVPASVNH